MIQYRDYLKSLNYVEFSFNVILTEESRYTYDKVYLIDFKH